MTANHEQMERTTRPPVLSVASSPVVRSLRTGQRGFTLIELLIVVVIVSILAAIAIPKFASSKEKAYVSKMISDLRNLATAQESYTIINQVYYGGVLPSAAMVYNPSQNVVVTVSVANAIGWGATAAYPSATTRTCALFVGVVAPPAPATVEGVIACTP